MRFPFVTQIDEQQILKYLEAEGSKRDQGISMVDLMDMSTNMTEKCS